MDEKQLFLTLEGTPQGGVISPLLANIALHGMEERIKEFAKTLDIKKPKGKGQVGWPQKCKGLNLIRYADDFVILHEDITVVQKCRKIISEWLKDMNLELNANKTRIAHTLYRYGEEPPGFNFLGFNIRQHPSGKYTSGKNPHGRLLGFSTIITPSDEKVKIHLKGIAKVIDTHRGKTQTDLIKALNLIITGWANYYRTVPSSKDFQKLDYLMYQKLRAWANHRHSNKSEKWVLNKYWQTIGDEHWVFATIEEGKYPLRLRRHGQTKIINHAKVKGESSPYDGNLVYWSTRIGHHPQMPKRTATLLKTQKGRCAHCGLFLFDSDVLEVDHKIPKSKGGKDCYENWQLLHRHCHDKKTVSDDGKGTQSDCNRVKPKPPSKPEWSWIEDMLVMRYV